MKQVMNVYVDYKVKCADKNLLRFVRNEIHYFAKQLFKRHGIEIECIRMGSGEIDENNR